MNLYRPITSIMTTNLITIKPNTILSEISTIFDRQKIHHLPVVDEQYFPVGIVSRHDYLQMQHHYTKFGWEHAEAQNAQLFSRLHARDIMTSNPVCLEAEETIFNAIDLFLNNAYHSVIVTDAGICVGIITPYDIIKEAKKLSVVLK